MSVVYSKMQRTSAPDIDDLKDKRIEIKYIYTEPDGTLMYGYEVSWTHCVLMMIKMMSSSDGTRDIWIQKK